MKRKILNLNLTLTEHLLIHKLKLNVYVFIHYTPLVLIPQIHAFQIKCRYKYSHCNNIIMEELIVLLM